MNVLNLLKVDPFGFSRKLDTTILAIDVILRLLTHKEQCAQEDGEVG